MDTNEHEARLLAIADYAPATPAEGYDCRISQLQNGRAALAKALAEVPVDAEYVQILRDRIALHERVLLEQGQFVPAEAAVARASKREATPLWQQRQRGKLTKEQARHPHILALVDTYWAALQAFRIVEGVFERDYAGMQHAQRIDLMQVMDAAEAKKNVARDALTKAKDLV